MSQLLALVRDVFLAPGPPSRAASAGKPGGQAPGAAADARGLAAQASGRLVRVRLPDDPASASAAAERAAATGSVPVVVGLAGPRQPTLDRLLRVQDVIVVVHGADADGAFADAVEASWPTFGI